METALVIMAAGLGSRFKGGIKQLEAVGPNGEIIMDYSVYDALEAGFDKVVFIIRKEIEAAFHAAIGQRLANAGIQVQYVYQSLADLPEGVNREKLLSGRTKPWGTGQAVLSCKGLVDCPFAVINADDYYGKEAYRQIHQFLVENHQPNAYCMAGFLLKNTLSEHGGVTRGLCKTNDRQELVSVVETHNITKDANGVDGIVEGHRLSGDAWVSMNMWGLKPEFFEMLEQGFVTFLRNQEAGNAGEYLLPTILGGLVERGAVRVQVLPTGDQWFGVTYREDKQGVMENIRARIAAGAYPERLFG